MDTRLMARPSLENFPGSMQIGWFYLLSGVSSVSLALESSCEVSSVVLSATSLVSVWTDILLAIQL